MTIDLIRGLIVERAEQARPLLLKLTHLTGAGGDELPPDFRARQVREVRTELATLNRRYATRIAEAARKAVADPQRRFATGSPHKAEALAEAQLVVTRYAGRTRQEQAGLVSDIGAALDAGDTARARVLARAAEALGITLGSIARRLEDADPVRRDARDALDAIAGLVEVANAEPLRELAGAGLATPSEQVRVKAFAAERRMRPDAPFPAQVEPGYAGATVESGGFPIAPFPEPYNPERDQQRKVVERLRSSPPATPEEAEERYAHR